MLNTNGPFDTNIISHGLGCKGLESDMYCKRAYWTVYCMINVDCDQGHRKGRKGGKEKMSFLAKPCPFPIKTTKIVFF